MSGPDLAGPIDLPLSITSAGVSGLAPRFLKLKLQPSLCTFSGKFTQPGGVRIISFDGAFRGPFDGEPGQGCGVFRGPSAAGSALILPATP